MLTSTGKRVQYIATRNSGYVSCDGHTPPIFLTDEEGDSPLVVYGCGDAHPFTDDGVPACGIDLCHGQPADDGKGSAYRSPLPD